MLISKLNIAVFVILFCLSSPVIVTASIFTDTSSCCDITFEPNGEISIGRNYDSTSASDFNTSSIGDTLINKKLKQPYKQKYGRSKTLEHKQVMQPPYNNRLKVTENFKDDDTKDKVFEFYPSIPDDTFSDSSKTKDSKEQLYKF